MKKFFIGMTGIALCLCLTACGKTAAPSSIANLSNQLDSTANALSSISSVSPTEISLSSSNKNNELYINSQLTQQSLINEQYYKTEILDRTATIKNKLEDITLSKMQKSAINDLTNTLNKYTNAIQNSKYEMNSSAKAISSMKKNTTKNEEKLKAKYNRLACNSNMRSAYYENILGTLDEIEDCLKLSCKNCEQPTECDSDENCTTQAKQTIKKNIDTYQKNDEQKSSNEDTDNETLPPAYYKKRHYNNPNRYNTIYNRFDRFNPSRNTDTYGPNRRNIDTYNGYGYNGGYGFNNYGYGNANNPYGMNPYQNGYGYGNNFYAGSNYGNRMTAPMPAPAATYANTAEKPEQRLETYEKTTENNIVEKIETTEETKETKTEVEVNAAKTKEPFRSLKDEKLKDDVPSRKVVAN